MKIFVKSIAVPSLLACALFASPAMAVTSLSGNVVINPDVVIINGADVLANNVAIDSFSGAPTNLTATTSSLTLFGASSIVADGFARAQWTNANSGSFQGFMRWAFGLQNDAGGGSAAFTASPDSWTYSFSSVGSTQLALAYEVVGSGSTFAFWGWDLLLDGNIILPLQNASDPTTAGSFNYLIAGAGAHTLTLRQNANIFIPGAVNDYVGQVTGRFDWGLTDLNAGVPEPASWAMMLGGFAFAGSALRRRRAGQIKVSFG